MRNNKLEHILLAFNVLLCVTVTSGFLAPVPHATESIVIDTVSPPFLKKPVKKSGED